jgi:hypothetical protein
VLENYYPATFPSFWEHFNKIVAEGRCGSVAEVERELERHAARQHLIDWLAANRSIFATPDTEEMRFVGEIFAVPHFQALVGGQQLTVGSPVADPWVIARAKSLDGTVVTEEAMKPNAAKIPNVCQHFGVRCMNLEGMLAAEGWRY